MSFDNINSALSGLNNYGLSFFLGKVKAVDEEGLDRVRVEVNGLYQSENIEDLPWAGPIKVSAMGYGEGYGEFGAPPVGSDVIVFLQEGNPHYPMYMSVKRYATLGGDACAGGWGWTDKFGNKFWSCGPNDMGWSTPCGAKIVFSDCKITFTAPGGFDFEGESRFHGNVIIDYNLIVYGLTTALGGLIAKWIEALQTITAQGDINSGGTIAAVDDVLTNGISLKNHKHLAPGGETSPPFQV